jgi:predicted PhzF superfamily epimerase YddE/YHI9
MTVVGKALPFHLVDVFTIEPLTGNPLAVVDGGEDLTRFASSS